MWMRSTVLATFILVHGGQHGGWCWEGLEHLLSERGHRVWAPDLPGMGADTTPTIDVSLELWANSIASLVEAQPSPPILVGHSRGGIILSEVAERIPQSLAGLVYCTAMLLENGETMMGAAERLMPHLAGRISITEDGLCSGLDSSAAAQTFYNMTDKGVAENAVRRLTPEPLRPNTAPIRISPDRFGKVPRAYIECAKDNVIPLCSQRKMHDKIPCEIVIRLESDHSPFFSQLEQLSEALDIISKHSSFNKIIT